ncbi:MAG: hypothetical protein FWE36_04115 [Erysipelotrichales bacterium]|nr:hypothetical protein [Erysipelotrichales bacterium]
MLLLWKLKNIVAFVMFVASTIALISFAMNIGNVVDAFRDASGFSGFAEVVSFTIHLLGTPLILFTLGLVALFLPKPNNK